MSTAIFFMKVNETAYEMHDILLKKVHSEDRCQYDHHCQLLAISLQAAIPEGGSEEELLKPTDRQAVNNKIKRLQKLKEKSEKLERMPSDSLKVWENHHWARVRGTLQ